MLPTKFRIIWPRGYRREEFFKSVNQKQESPVAAMFVNGSGRNEQSLQRTFHRCFPHVPSFGSFGQVVSEEKIFKNSDICIEITAFWIQIYTTHSHLSKVFGNVKKSLYNQPKPYFFKKLLWSHFWINFNIFTFGIVYILFVYLLIMFIRVVFICT